ncbi:MAG TPA: outer membrane protein assembly factor BamA [Bryobacteraceae bacterium]|nr:outer membrane protein assembly factor BamA [Bryobacteraceae bacterium]
MLPWRALLAFAVLLPLAAQTPPQQNPPQPPASSGNPQGQQPPQPPQQPRNPFENVPQLPGQPQQQPPAQQPAQPQLETPKAPAPVQQPQANGQVIKAIDFRGARRVPADTLRAMIFSKVGDIYSDEAIRRDFMRLWNQGRFDDIRVETEPDPTGGVDVRFVVTERRVVRTINYEGIHTVTVSEILDRFKERKVGLVVESQYDPNKVQRAAIVLKEFLAERGRQYASVDPVIEQIPPSSLKLTFNVKEGPKVKVGNIIVTGNKAETQRWVVESMKELKPYGIPHSIIFENIFAKTYDQDKLEYDKEKIREAYQDKGYFQAKVLDETVKIVPKGGRGWRLPIIRMQEPGIYADITLPVEEGRLHYLHSMNFVGVKLFRTPSVLMGAFGMKEGDVFAREKLTKGLENLRKIYGGFGYIDFVPEPDFGNVTNGQIDLTITCDEGKQFFIRRIDFAGNTTTRDKVIRRELLLDEGDMFNSNLWDISILRLNQLGYFEPLKKEDAADIKRNPDSNTVDITLKVKERGKNSIGLNGGVSGIAGSFVGFNYSTNNFLGLGETLSLGAQLGTLMRDVTFGFTEPYLFDHPIQASFTVYLRRYNFDQARQASILTGQNLIPLYQSLGTNNLLNYIQNSKGFNTGLSYQLHRSFWRAGIVYGYDISNIQTTTTAATQYFDYINFSGVYGPNALDGIKTSTITPSLSYNTVNHPINPTGGKSIFFSLAFAGSYLGGNVNTVRPTIDLKYFHPSPIYHRNILAFHLTTDIITGYGGKSIPPFSRSFMGGEQDIRGFDWWSITPLAFIPSSTQVSVLNSDGSQRTQKVVSGGVLTSVPVTMTVPQYQLITPGGDWRSYGNFEYRIPIVGPVTLAIFTDAGVNRILQPNQLTMDPQQVINLNQQFPQAGFSGKVQIAPGTQKFRMSSGLELQVLLPVVNAPFRVYFAYNPSTVREYLQPPVVADRSMFPNAATYNAYLAANQAGFYPYFERRTLFRFTIGRTF